MSDKVLNNQTTAKYGENTFPHIKNVNCIDTRKKGVHFVVTVDRIFYYILLTIVTGMEKMG